MIKAEKVHKFISWSVTVSLSLWAVYLALMEVPKITGGERVKLAKVESSNGLEKGRNLLIKTLSDELNIDAKSISCDDMPRAELKIECQSSMADKIIATASAIDFTLRELRIQKIVCSNDGTRLATYVTTPNFMGTGVAPNLIVSDILRAEMEKSSGIMRDIMSSTRSVLLKEVERHTQRYLKQDANDPLLLLDNIIIAKLRNNDSSKFLTSLTTMAEASNESNRERDRLAARLVPFSQIAEAGELSDSAKKEKLLNSANENLPNDYFQSYLLAVIEKKSLHDVPANDATLGDFAKQRDKTIRLLTVIAMLTTVSFGVLIWTLTRATPLWRLPPNTMPPVSQQAWGWIKPPIACFLSFAFSNVTMVALYIQCPPLLVLGGSTMIVYFHPEKIAMMELANQLITTFPLIFFSYLLVGKASSFTDFARLKFRTAQYTLSSFIYQGAMAFGICWSMAAVCMLLSMWFHYPGDKSTTIGLGLLATSGSATAIAIWYLGYAILAPLTEEIIFRGILYPSLRRHWSPQPTMLFTALIFALVHNEFTPWWLLYKIVFGYINAYLVEKTGSIVPGLISHLLINGTAVLFLILAS
ncbi:MAG: CPBP family intramembrane metalloprotease [Candidatus Obscuribacterales bacterium]|nr:CPBP family intramembrane metalloprotease [Candidatus Obscuribacterales bacterium]